MDSPCSESTRSGEGILYLDGEPCGRSTTSQTALSSAVKTSEITLAKSNDSPATAEIFMTGVLNGLIKDVRVINASLSGESINSILESSKPYGLPDLEINGDWFPNDPQRPLYHALPPRAWTNEPHGLIYWKGEYHLFYQKNANGPYWGHINWGHMTSPDMYRWTEKPVAISPEPGPDSEGCWSGSVIEHEGKLALIYTGGNGHQASICLAQSEDGVHFTKHPANPIIPEPPQGSNFPEFRDPFVWREGECLLLDHRVRGERCGWDGPALPVGRSHFMAIPQTIDDWEQRQFWRLLGDADLRQVG